jgi:hypothetical protein
VPQCLISHEVAEDLAVVLDVVENLTSILGHLSVGGEGDPSPATRLTWIKLEVQGSFTSFESFEVLSEVLRLRNNPNSFLFASLMVDFPKHALRVEVWHLVGTVLPQG